eukprot:TRINITY_DN9066_c1_g1_i1.p2 TRINITY_DN9066_c1_g1~~TRINITY_DN9066_c1_g1_i1.p2  ORF type:complete len:318 (-),score=80.21 TRINITY_DN9066_c1_g1_i1:1292-2245(-)
MQRREFSMAQLAPGEGVGMAMAPRLDAMGGVTREQLVQRLANAAGNAAAVASLGELRVANNSAAATQHIRECFVAHHRGETARAGEAPVLFFSKPHGQLGDSGVLVVWSCAPATSASMLEISPGMPVFTAVAAADGVAAATQPLPPPTLCARSVEDVALRYDGAMVVDAWPCQDVGEARSGERRPPSAGRQQRGVETLQHALQSVTVARGLNIVLVQSNVVGEQLAAWLDGASGALPENVQAWDVTTAIAELAPQLAGGCWRAGAGATGAHLVLVGDAHPYLLLRTLHPSAGHTANSSGALDGLTAEVVFARFVAPV